jgi:hypothetical protein
MLHENRLRQIIEHEKRRQRALAVCLFLQIVFIVLVVSLAGCASQARTQTQTRTVGVQAGQEVNISTTSTTLASETTGVDVASLVTAALQASQGKILGALEAIKPQPLPEYPRLEQIAQAVTASQKPQGTDWATLGTGTIAALLAAYAAQQRKEAQSQKREREVIEIDRDKMYDQHIDLCKKLPPESLKG